eukprot:GHRR01001104.1.p1 GENE.GHRR01001104.1~~GHRR01001104.1.p1  ORF type:complete len:841 (+),score=348.67 GHRR01001104.1:396-2918(+)
MAQPYIGYSGYPPQQASAWPGYPGSTDPYAYPSGSYSYSGYYAQQPASVYGNYAGWQSQQAAAAAEGVAAPQQPPGSPPPLPPGAPPPLPDEAPSSAGSKDMVEKAEGAASQPAAGQDAAAQQVITTAAQHAYYQGQYAHYGAAPYSGHGAHSGYGGYAQHAYSQYPYASHPGSSTNLYASQVNPSGAPAVAITTASTSAPTTHDFTKVHLSSSAAGGSSGPAKAATATGGNATPIGQANAAGQQPLSLEAMRAAAAETAKRLQLQASTGSARPQYVAVNSAPPAGTTAAARGAGDLPLSLQQYVQRALALVVRHDAARSELREVLRDMIAKHKKEGTMWSTDWDTMPLPKLKSMPQEAGTSDRPPVWDRLGSAGSSKQQQQQAGWQQSGSRKRGRYGYNSNSDSDNSSSDRSYSRDGGNGYVNGYNKKGRQRHQQHNAGAKTGQQHLGKKGKRGRQWKLGQQQWTDEEQAKQAARSARFGNSSNQRNSTLAAYGWDEDTDARDATAAGEFIAGTCQTLEKRYLRLTRAPLPEEVRPQPVLERALQRLLGMIQAKQDKYLYYNDQFKAMRQDLTVQGIKNDFTVQVYEAHARAALEYGDTAEYNQCQTQLAILYAGGIPGSHAEFGAYRLLYQAVHAAAGEGRKLLGTMRQLLANKLGQVAASPEVQHALQVRQALASANVSRFFRLYASAPRLGRRLMDEAVRPLRWKALNTLVRAHKPGLLPLTFLAPVLGFVQQDNMGLAAGAPAAGVTVNDAGQLLPGCAEVSCAGDNGPAAYQQEGLQACLAWCKQHGAMFDDETDLLKCNLATKECWSRLVIPQDTTKVAHGDVNLDIRDFLAL